MEAIASKSDGAIVGVHEHGSGGTPLLFVHGLVGDHRDFDRQVAFFSPRHRVVTVDLPGSVRPTRSRSSWTMEALGEDVATVVEALDLEGLVFIGHSLGGNAVLEAAANLNPRVKGVVLVSSFRSLGTVTGASDLERWFAPFESDFPAAMDDLCRRNFGPGADPVLVESAVARARDAEKGRAIALLASKSEHEGAVVGLLERVDAPVIAINPDFKPNDRSSFDRHGVELRVVPGAGHFTMMEAPDSFNAELQSVLDDLGPAP